MKLMKVVNIINNIFFPMWVEYTLISNDIHAKKNANNNRLFIPNIYASSDPNTGEAKAKEWPLAIRIEYSLHLDIHAKRDSTKTTEC
jgi:hypothetical protein